VPTLPRILRALACAFALAACNGDSTGSGPRSGVVTASITGDWNETLRFTSSVDPASVQDVAPVRFVGARRADPYGGAITFTRVIAADMRQPEHSTILMLRVTGATVGTYDLGETCPDAPHVNDYPCAVGLLIRDQDMTPKRDVPYYDLGNGTITVESVSEGRLKGRFSVLGRWRPDASRQIAVTGTFDVPLANDEFLFTNWL
jgi:hypothetical protein